MTDLLLAAAEVFPDRGLSWGVAMAVFFAGLRHGFDLDHIAAITDITSSQPDKRRALRLATVYASGHAFVLLLLGMAAVLFGRSIPGSVDRAMGRVIGGTLVLLGLYVVVSLLRYRSDFRLQSRWMIVLGSIRQTLLWLRRHKAEVVEIEHVHEHAVTGHHHHPHGEDVPLGRHASSVEVLIATHDHPHKHVVRMPPDPFTEYGVATSFVIGAVHGVGAETASQLLLFTAAAGVAGSLDGVALLAAFVFGLFAGNTILAFVSAAGFAGGRKLPRLYLVLSGVTALISIYVGTLYVFDRMDRLPAWLGG